jgi:hypothetical protein
MKGHHNLWSADQGQKIEVQRWRLKAWAKHMAPEVSPTM